MTREEAIEVLRKNRPGADSRRCGLELCTAVDVAIAALRELEKLESNLKVLESSDWISVEERLPGPYQTVLVCRRHLGAPDCYMTTDRMVFLHGGITMWAGELKTWKSGVTHWMPLPEPPEVEA